MAKVKQILCIHPEPAELCIGALLNRQGIAVDLTEVSSSDTLRMAISQPQWWDLILCDAASYYDLDVVGSLSQVRDRLDASLVLLKSPEIQLSPAEGYRRGAADVLLRGDFDHLLMVAERELKNAAVRKRVRHLLYSSAYPDAETNRSLMVATITDLSSKLKSKQADLLLDEPGEVSGAGSSAAQTRIKSLIDAGGLVLEYQPIISFKANEEHRNMFEALVRLRDESGRLLLPESFLPIIRAAGWMDKIDLWIVRQALAILEEIQSGGAPDAVLFVNIATETLRSEQTVRAIGAFVSAASLAPGSIVLEVHKTAFKETPEALNRLAAMLRVKRHGLLVEDAKLDDGSFLENHRGLVTHVKLDRATTQGLVEGAASQNALNAFVACAHQEDVRVIALAVDHAALLPMLFGAGVDAIQGNFMSMPYESLVYPSVQRIEFGAAAVWRGPDASV
ncbi:EAL domain-containing protein [Thiobaca trueperi]|uniref:EAL domain-containing protein (Putative c-di-GMP-specific phosphodiesterase class I) n=1 Tax=Thiobaca trueperi TaxID=127458 RepID=A0A4R3N604_9GAMM|nr:EAL domain-containing protein [Thiobaca trueperi]TCT24194.1 EAL domain-containing protein (putative c-di-GMP-specific phosphodiesterase class I) [Thiobaca trueperi]